LDILAKSDGNFNHNESSNKIRGPRMSSWAILLTLLDWHSCSVSDAGTFANTLEEPLSNDPHVFGKIKLVPVSSNFNLKGFLRHHDGDTATNCTLRDLEL